MSRVKDILLAALATTTAVLAWTAWRQSGEIRRLEAGTPGKPAAISAVRFSTGVSRTHPVPAEASAGSARHESEGPLPARGRFGDTPRVRPRAASGLARLMEIPEFVEALGQQRQALLDARFAALFRMLRLDDEALARFKGLLLEKENVVLDVVTVSETAPSGPDAPETLRQSVRTAQTQVEQAIQTALGPERYGVYREYERTLPQRAVVAQLEQRLSYSPAPLAPAQADALVAILASSAPAAPAEPTPVVSMLVRAGVPETVPVLPTSAATGRVTDEAIMLAQGVLAPMQVAALREIQGEQRASFRAAEFIREFAPTLDLGPLAIPFMFQ